MKRAYILAIDQGTTSSRALIFDRKLKIAGAAQREVTQYFPRPGWVEHDPEEIWRTVWTTCRLAIRKAGIAATDIAAIGIANQRETVVIWDRKTGVPIHRAIVWQDRRTAEACAALRETGQESMVAERTGLLLDPYFSATKVAWLLDNVDGARRRAEQGDLCFGTIDSFLIWRLTRGNVHATDATNASRTMLFDIHSGTWSATLQALSGIPETMFGEVHDCAAAYGVTDRKILGGDIPIMGVAGDQQAAAIGQACFSPGMVKATYGTGAFVLLNTGDQPIRSTRRLLTTIAYQIDGQRTYALEGSIFVAGAALQWLRDGLGIIKHATDADTLAAQSDAAQAVYLVPAFVGLGAPYWDSEARGAIRGITGGTTAADLVRAALEAAAYQTRDLVEAMGADVASSAGMKTVLRVDGGMAASDWTMQFLADILNAPVDRPGNLETTALGAAYLAGYSAGMYPPPTVFSERWRSERRFSPRMSEGERATKWAGWRDAVQRTLTPRSSLR